MLVAAVVTSVPVALAAQGADRWTFTVAPTVYAPSQSGMIALAPIGFPGEMTNAGGGFALDIQARRREWSYVLDGYYVGLNQPYYTWNNNPGGATPDSGGLSGKQWSLQALALRRVVRSLEFGIGVAANGVRATGTVYAKTGNGQAPVPFTASASQDMTWVLPVVGARWTPVDGEQWHVSVFGEAGYFGSDNRSYQLLPSVGYRIGSAVEIAGRYRTLYTKYITGDLPSQTARSPGFSGAPPAAAYQPGRGVQDPVAQRLGLGFGQVAVQGQQLEPGQQDGRDHGGGQPRGVDA